MAHGLRPVGTILGRRPGSVGCFSYSPLPVTWSPIGVFLGINIILGFLGWTGLARAVRSKLLAPREEDFCTVAVLLGARPRRVIARHLHPNLMSHLIASATLSIPSMILGETALSFLGLGLRPPITSLGGAPQRVGCQSTQRTPQTFITFPTGRTDHARGSVPHIPLVTRKWKQTLHACSLDVHETSLALYPVFVAIRGLQEPANLHRVRPAMSRRAVWLPIAAIDVSLYGVPEFPNHDLAVPHGERSVASLPLGPCGLEVLVGFCELLQCDLRVSAVDQHAPLWIITMLQSCVEFAAASPGTSPKSHVSESPSRIKCSRSGPLDAFGTST